MGLRGQGAVVEIMGRLKNVIIEQDLSTKRLNTRLFYFTIAAFILTVIQIVLLIVDKKSPLKFFAFFIPFYPAAFLRI